MSEDDAPAAWPAQRLADALQSRGLAAPAILLLETLRPWRVVASQLLLLAEPLCGHARRPTVRRYADWLAAPDALEGLLARLERPQGDAP